jgi:hypothetical protein
VVLAACSDNGPRPRDVFTVLLYDSIGTYDVVPLGPGPLGGFVVPMDMNDSGIVVGFLQPPGGSARAFRWRAGTFEILEPAASSSVARAINNRGDIVGDRGVAVIWRAQETQPVPLFPPESTLYQQATAVDINEGRVVALAYNGSNTTVVNANTGAVGGRFPSFKPVAIGPAGEVLGVYVQLYPKAGLWRSPYPSQLSCGWGVQGGAKAFAINDSSVALMYLTEITEPFWAGPAVFRVANGCNEEISVDPGFPLGSVPVTSTGIVDDIELRALNNQRWFAGTIRGVESVMLAGFKGYAVLDSVLMASGEASARWRVTRVDRINSAGTFLVQVKEGEAAQQPALLVRRPH